jgi:hypothetical protein
MWQKDILQRMPQKYGSRETAVVMDFVMLNHDEICKRWGEYFHGDLSFYK